MKVSVITPTANRPEMLQRCIEQFLAQDWEDKEMIIVGDNLHDLEAYGCFKYPNVCIKLSTGNVSSIGSKRNSACSISKGEIILHMDDDDIYAPDWITRSVNHLLATGADMVGMKNAYFYRESDHKAWEYNYTGSQPCILGATMCYHKHAWDRTKSITVPVGHGKGMERLTFHGFPDRNNGEDTLFCHELKIAPHDYKEGFVAMQHETNTTGQKKYSGISFHPANANMVKQIVDAMPHRLAAQKAV